MTFRVLQERLYRLFLLCSASILVLNVLIILYSVFTRYLLNHSPIWSDELSRYAIIASVMLVMSCAYVDGRHMRVSYIEQSVSFKVRRIIKLYQWLIIMTVAGFFSYVSFQYALSLNKYSSMGLNVSKTVPLMSLPLGFMTLFIMTLIQGPFKAADHKEEEC